MTKAEARDALQQEWGPWIATIEAVPTPGTRVPGAVGDWTLHDVVNHVQCYARFQLSQARGAMSGMTPNPNEWYGDREAPQDISRDASLDQRNERIREAGRSLTWQQLLNESAWLWAETRDWIDSLDEAQVDELIGWVPYWVPDFKRDPEDEMILLVRRVREVPAVVNQVPLWRYVLPGDHMAEHLRQLQAWLTSARPTP